MMKSLTVLGSTGSVGTQTLEVARQNGYRVCALSAGRNVSLAEKQAREFMPDTVAMADENAAKELRSRLRDTDIRVLSGEDGIMEAAAEPSADIAVCAIVGVAGLKPALAAIKAKKTVALANKETLVTAGSIVKKAARENGVKIIPVDSEHSAIFQSLQGAPEGSLRKIILTASGGPFYGMTREQLLNVTAADALRHPNWTMGKKITIDCATLMNKGFEVMEAVHLFDVAPCDVEVLIHRQSILHSAVEFCDGAVIGQMGTPDMKLPIQYAITYPERKEAYSRLDLATIGSLTFAKPDTETFECLPLCIEAIEKGGLYPAALNGANEETVRLFLDGRIRFTDIATLNREAAFSIENKTDFDLDDVFEADSAAREYIKEHA